MADFTTIAIDSGAVHQIGINQSPALADIIQIAIDPGDIIVIGLDVSSIPVEVIPPVLPPPPPVVVPLTAEQLAILHIESVIANLLASGVDASLKLELNFAALGSIVGPLSESILAATERAVAIATAASNEAIAAGNEIILQGQYDSIVALVAGTALLDTVAEQSRSTVDTALAALAGHLHTIEAISAASGENTAAILVQGGAYADSTISVAAQITHISAVFDGNATGLTQTYALVANATSTAATSVFGLSAAFGNNAAAFTLANTAYASATTSTASSLTGMTVNVGSNYASLQSALAVGATATSTVATSLNAFSTNFGSGVASYSQQVALLSTAVSSTSTSATDLGTAFGNGVSSLHSAITSSSNATGTLTTATTSMVGAFGSNGAGLQQSIGIGASATQTVATAATALAVSFGGNDATYKQQYAVLATANNTTSTLVSAQAVTFGNNSAGVNSALTVTASAANTVAVSQQAAQVTFGANSAGFANTFTALADSNGSAATALSQFQAVYNGQVVSYNSQIGVINTNQGTTAGLVSTLQLSPTPSGNNLANSELSGYDGWTNGSTVTGTTFGINDPGWCAPPTVNVLYCSFPGTPASGQYADWSSPPIPTTHDTRYEASVLAAFHRAYACQIFIGWYDVSGALISDSFVGQGGTSGGSGGGVLTNYQQIGGFATSPSNAASRKLLLRTICDGEVSPYGWFTHPYTGLATALQNILSPYQPGTQANVAAISAAITNAEKIASDANGVTAQSVTDLTTTYNSQVTSYDSQISLINTSAGTQAGYVTTLKSNSAAGGGTGNLLANSDIVGNDGWVYYSSTNTTETHGLNLGGYFPPSKVPGVLWAQMSGTPAVNTVCQWNSPKIPVQTGARYEINAAVAFHRASRVEVFAVTYDGNGTTVSYIFLSSGGRSYGAGNGDPANFDTVGGFYTIPSGVAYVSILMQVVADGSQVNPYGFQSRPQIRLASAGQTAFTPYASGTQVNVQSVTDSITVAANIGGGAQTTANGAVTTANSALGNTQAGAGGGNDVANSELQGHDNFSFFDNSGGQGNQGYIDNSGTPAHLAVLYVDLNGTPAADVSCGCKSPVMNAVPGIVYESSVAAIYYRTNRKLILYLVYFDAGGNQIGAPSWSGGRENGNYNGDVSNFDRIGGFSTAPAGAVTRQLYFQLYADGGGNNPYIFFTHPMSRVANAGQTTLSAYHPGTQANVTALAAATTAAQSTATSANTAAGNAQGTANSATTAAGSAQTDATNALNNTKGAAGGGNDLPNSDLKGYDGWNWYNSGGAGAGLQFNPVGYSNSTSGVLFSSTGSGSGACADWNSPIIAAEPGVVYEASVMAAGQGSAPNLQMYIGFWNSSGGLFAYSGQLQNIVKAGLQPDNGNLADYTRIGGFATAPAGTVGRSLLLRTYAPDGGSQNGFFQHPFTRVASTGQTALSPYSAGTQVNVAALIAATATAKQTADGGLSAANDALGKVGTINSTYSVQLRHNTTQGGYEIVGVTTPDGANTTYAMIINANVIISGTLLVNGTVSNTALIAASGSYYLNYIQGVGDNVSTTIALNTTNIPSTFCTLNADGTVTVNSAGTYAITGQYVGEFKSPIYEEGFFQLQLFVNGAELIGVSGSIIVDGANGYGTGGQSLSLSDAVVLNAGDILTLKGYVHAANYDAYYTHFNSGSLTITRVGS